MGYCIMSIYIAGYVFAVAMAISVVVFLVLAALLYRIHIEEKVLNEQFGQEYQTYCQNTYRLIPFVY